MKNLYRLQTLDGQSYSPSSRDRANTLIETERAEWIGTDWDEDLNAFVHYADRITT